MPLENNTKMDEKPIWNFTNILALILSVGCLSFLFTITFVLSKSDVKDNTMLSQVTTGIIGLQTLIAAYYFGSSMGSARQQATITEMQKDATSLASKTADAAIASVTGSKPVDVQNKVDKAVLIEQLRTKLAGMQPDSEEALALVTEIERLEKES